MSYGNIDGRIGQFYDHCLQEGFSQARFFTRDNLGGFIAASVDAYRDYPLFLHVFGGRYDENTLAHMMKIDLGVRLKTMAGIACEGFESVMMAEPPLAKKTGMLQYFGSASPKDYLLLFNPAICRQEIYEKYAARKREEYLDDKTWYIYIFATRKKYQCQGYGKQLMNLLLSFADKTGGRICLETDLADNVPMYERFGFKTVDISLYKGVLEHFVMLYAGKER